MCLLSMCLSGKVNELKDVCLLTWMIEIEKSIWKKLLSKFVY